MKSPDPDSTGSLVESIVAYSICFLWIAVQTALGIAFVLLFAGCEANDVSAFTQALGTGINSYYAPRQSAATPVSYTQPTIVGRDIYGNPIYAQ